MEAIPALPELSEKSNSLKSPTLDAYNFSVGSDVGLSMLNVDELEANKLYVRGSWETSNAALQSMLLLHQRFTSNVNADSAAVRIRNGVTVVSPGLSSKHKNGDHLDTVDLNRINREDDIISTKQMMTPNKAMNGLNDLNPLEVPKRSITKKRKLHQRSSPQLSKRSVSEAWLERYV